jgi:hypothetical protein
LLRCARNDVVRPAVFHGMIGTIGNKGFACTNFVWQFCSAL